MRRRGGMREVSLDFLRKSWFIIPLLFFDEVSKSFLRDFLVHDEIWRNDSRGAWGDIWDEKMRKAGWKSFEESNFVWEREWKWESF